MLQSTFTLIENNQLTSSLHELRLKGDCSAITAPGQFVIGTYIVDFCIYSARMVIELDGSQHFEAHGLAYDRNRDRFLNEQGFTVLRYSNRDINQHFQNVCNDILMHLHQDF